MLLAAESTGGGGSTVSLLLMMGLIFGAMYFLMIRPQQKRRRQVESMQSGLGVGDEVVTIGGLYGTVTDLTDEIVSLEVAPGVTNQYARRAISHVVTSAPRLDDLDDVDDSEDTAIEKTTDKD
ncbi:MAG TPA: preprotein translocase subunit YajC [Micromonosporaceae bacterium]|nr:preprotein translocase subunit YajC [Micromonosporaceae bacterium]